VSPHEWDPKALRHENRNLDNPVVVASDLPVVSVEEAADLLSLSVVRTRVLANSGFLEPCRHPGGATGVSLRSVDTERQWRAEAGILARVRRFCFHILRNVS
jgi:hypothetical protein